MAKDYFFRNEHSAIINEDLFATKKIAAGSIDLVVTSPPYNVDIQYNSHDDRGTYAEYLDFSARWMKRCHGWLKGDGRFCLNIPLDKNKGGQQSVGADLTTIAKEAGFSYHSTIIWNEGNISRRTAWGSWVSASAPYVIAPVELVVVLYKDSWKKTSGSLKSDITKEEFMAWTNGLWTFNGESRKKVGHPAPFPVESPSPVHEALLVRRRHGARPVHGEREHARRHAPVRAERDRDRDRCPVLRACAAADRSRKLTPVPAGMAAGKHSRWSGRYRFLWDQP